MMQDGRFIFLAGGILTGLFVLCLAGMAVFLPAPADATGWWAAAGGAATALATIGLVIATGLLWIVTRESAQAAERAATAAERAAKSAEDAHVSAQETAKRQLRAYLDPCVSSKFVVNAAKNPVITFDVKNVGQTPAYDFAFESEAILQKDGETCPEFKPVVSSNSSSFLGAGETLSCLNTKCPVLSAKDIEDIRSGKTFLFLSVRVEYVDIFLDSHVSETCLRYGWDVEANQVVTVSMRARNYRADPEAT